MDKAPESDHQEGAASETSADKTSSRPTLRNVRFDAPEIVDFLQRATLRAQRDGAPLGILLFDFSDDGDGSARGRMTMEKSRRIRQFATNVSAALGPDSICGRVSEFELLAILPGADQDAAEEAAKQVVQRTIGRGKGMRSHVFELAPAALSEDDPSVGAFIERARASMVQPDEFLPQADLTAGVTAPVDEAVEETPAVETDAARPKTASIEI